ncbi:hypothetical protein LTR78_006725 [Recurvomyces mirabilis]|uniref:Amidase domain-containing protein n=1 Tax=Recurvomyces mirabilis TaxID=574656 RepID=A0AAE1BZN2_9PEZI|nr:hypothetical protein LTR78_006725 [Recurvomyces mirabilis]KAK5151385.1 hypothetical protein LTS14_009228 [Recurvomyces mirabilis]
MLQAKDIDVLTLTATQAEELLDSKQLTSATLVEAYLAQIEKNNHNGLHLNSLISITAKDILLNTARHLDHERETGHKRGPLHGIPFIVKDVFVTDRSLGMPTTCGAAAFATSMGKRNAPLIQHLLDQGMILLGKANLTEFCGLKFKGMTPGWSTVGGQTQNPYVFGGLEENEKLIGHSSAGGSSSGSAVGVAAGFAPLSIGTECCGSLITPANRAGMYALKCSLGSVDVEACFGYTDCLDCIGGMAKSAQDLATFIAALLQRGEAFDLGGGMEGMRVAFTDVMVWRLPEDFCGWPGDTREQLVGVTQGWPRHETMSADVTQEAGYASIQDMIKAHGAEIETDIDLSNAPTLFQSDEGKSYFYEIAFYQLRNKYFPTFFDELAESEVHSLPELIEWNKKHSPKQDELEDLLANTRKPEDIDKYINDMRERGRDGLDRHLERNDIVVALADSPLVQYSATAGYPIACLPLGIVKYSETNERPYGICMIAGKGREDILLRFMAACESLLPPRPVPKPLLQQ